MEDVTAHGVMLLLLDHDRHRLRAVQLEVEQGVALREQHAQLPGGDLEGPRLATLPVDDAWHQALAAQAASRPRSEGVALRDLECGSVLCHRWVQCAPVRMGRLRSGARIENV